MLGTTGMVVGILNSYDRFGAFAISPFFWNVAIIVVLVAMAPLFHGDNRIYAYAIGVLVGTAIQLAIPTWDLRHTPFRLLRVFDWRSLEVRRVLLLMLPVTLSLGLINFNLLINSIFGTLVSAHAPAAIDKAFRIYMLPQGIFSVAVTTVVFPTLARLAARREYDDLRATMANGMRQIVLLLIPAAAAILVLSVPMIRLVYQRGEFSPGDTEVVATALFWFAFSLPFNGLFLLLTRTFFSLQRPWVPTAISGVNLAITATRRAAALRALRRRRDRRRHRDRDRGQRARADDRPAPPARPAGARAGWSGPRLASAAPPPLWRGRATASGTCSTRPWAAASGGQIVSPERRPGGGAAVYAAAITLLRIPEAQQIWRLLRGREPGTT